MNYHKVITTSGVTASTNSGDFFTKEQAESDCKARNERALALGIATRYEVAKQDVEEAKAA